MGCEAGPVECRGRCDAALPGNMGKLMRSTVVRNLREGMGPSGAGEAPQARKAPEINVCCHGQDAGDEVTCTSFPTYQVPERRPFWPRWSGYSARLANMQRSGIRAHISLRTEHKMSEQLSCHVNCSSHALLSCVVITLRASFRLHATGN